MNNLLHFPTGTIVNKKVSKSSFYKRALPKQQNNIKTFLTNCFEKIIWLYKLAPSTLNVLDGKNVHEIDIFICQMKDKNFNYQMFYQLDELLPRHTLFITISENNYKAIMHYKEYRLINNERKWFQEQNESIEHLDLSKTMIEIKGQSMDSIYFGFLSQMTGLTIENSKDYFNQTEFQKQITLLEKTNSNLYKKIKLEKQFNRQLEIRDIIRNNNKEINKLNKKINYHQYE